VGRGQKKEMKQNKNKRKIELKFLFLGFSKNARKKIKILAYSILKYI
jgi:hypothetical protein